MASQRNHLALVQDRVRGPGLCCASSRFESTHIGLVWYLGEDIIQGKYKLIYWAFCHISEF